MKAGERIILNSFLLTVSINLPAEPSKKEFKPISDYLSSNGMSNQAINALRGNMNVDDKSDEEK